LKNLAAGLLVFGTILPAALPAQDLTILAPNGGETYIYGSTFTVEWQNNGVPSDLMLEYTDNGGSYWYYLYYISAGDPITSVTVQNYLNPSELNKVRIYSVEDSSFMDESDGYFSVIESPIYFSSPYFGESYYRNQPVYISWYAYTLTTFNLDYSLNNGATWTNIATNYTGFDYTWTAADQVSDQVFIRISDASNPDSYGLSPVFSIVEIPEMTVTSPNGGETWNYGESTIVSWTGSNLPLYIYIDVSTDGGATWMNIGYSNSEPTGGSALVWVPYVTSDNALIKIYDPYYPEANDVSDAFFTIFVPPVIVNYPYEGQQFYNTSDMYTSWMAIDAELVNIELSSDNGQTYNTVAENIDANLSYYYFTINASPSEACILKVSDASDPTQFGLSQTFTILEAPVITLTAPAGGEIFNTESPVTITWLYNNPESYYIFLEYSTDNGQTWNYISYVPNDLGGGSYSWYTPVVNSQECLIRVTDYYLGFVKDTSAAFTILPFPQTPICMVSVDSTTNHNIIVWEKPVSDMINQFIVYKESNEANVYEVMGTVDYNSPAVITDSNSNPTMKPYRYKLGFSDAAGNIFPMSDFHQTIHLTINQGVGNTWNLIWSDYVGFEVSSYNIHRKTANGSYEQLASISGSFNSYTDLTAPAGAVYYVVEVPNPGGCNAASREDDYSSTYSNVATNSTLSIGGPENTLSVSVYPNPANSQINVIAGQELSGNQEITLTDLLGKKVYTARVSDLRPGMKHMINAEALREGIYILKVSSNNGSYTGKVIVKH
jgi:hypothetical protein